MIYNERRGDIQTAFAIRIRERSPALCFVQRETSVTLLAWNSSSAVQETWSRSRHHD